MTSIDISISEHELALFDLDDAFSTMSASIVFLKTNPPPSFKHQTRCWFPVIMVREKSTSKCYWMQPTIRMEETKTIQLSESLLVDPTITDFIWGGDVECLAELLGQEYFNSVRIPLKDENASSLYQMELYIMTSILPKARTGDLVEVRGQFKLGPTLDFFNAYASLMTHPLTKTYPYFSPFMKHLIDECKRITPLSCQIVSVDNAMSMSATNRDALSTLIEKDPLSFILSMISTDKSSSMLFNGNMNATFLVQNNFHDVRDLRFVHGGVIAVEQVDVSHFPIGSMLSTLAILANKTTELENTIISHGMVDRHRGLPMMIFVVCSKKEEKEHVIKSLRDYDKAHPTVPIWIASTSAEAKDLCGTKHEHDTIIWVLDTPQYIPSVEFGVASTFQSFRLGAVITYMVNIKDYQMIQQPGSLLHDLHHRHFSGGWQHFTLFAIHKLTNKTQLEDLCPIMYMARNTWIPDYWFAGFNESGNEKIVVGPGSFGTHSYPLELSKSNAVRIKSLTWSRWIARQLTTAFLNKNCHIWSRQQVPIEFRYRIVTLPPLFGSALGLGSNIPHIQLSQPDVLIPKEQLESKYPLATFTSRREVVTPEIKIKNSSILSSSSSSSSSSCSIQVMTDEEEKDEKVETIESHIQHMADVLQLTIKPMKCSTPVHTPVPVQVSTSSQEDIESDIHSIATCSVAPSIGTHKRKEATSPSPEPCLPEQPIIERVASMHDDETQDRKDEIELNTLFMLQQQEQQSGKKLCMTPTPSPTMGIGNQLEQMVITAFKPSENQQSPSPSHSIFDEQNEADYIEEKEEGENDHENKNENENELNQELIPSVVQDDVNVDYQQIESFIQSELPVDSKTSKLRVILVPTPLVNALHQLFYQYRRRRFQIDVHLTPLLSDQSMGIAPTYMSYMANLSTFLNNTCEKLNTIISTKPATVSIQCSHATCPIEHQSGPTFISIQSEESLKNIDDTLIYPACHHPIHRDCLHDYKLQYFEPHERSLNIYMHGTSHGMDGHTEFSMAGYPCQTCGRNTPFAFHTLEDIIQAEARATIVSTVDRVDTTPSDLFKNNATMSPHKILAPCPKVQPMVDTMRNIIQSHASKPFLVIRVFVKENWILEEYMREQFHNMVQVYQSNHPEQESVVYQSKFIVTEYSDKSPLNLEEETEEEHANEHFILWDYFSFVNHPQWLFKTICPTIQPVTIHALFVPNTFEERYWFLASSFDYINIQIENPDEFNLNPHVKSSGIALTQMFRDRPLSAVEESLALWSYLL